MSSDAGGETCRGNIRSRQDARACADVEAAQLELERQRRRDAERIHFEQKAKQLRMELWALRQHAELMDQEADDVDRFAERKMSSTTTLIQSCPNPSPP